jgi:hypothetical protein
MQNFKVVVIHDDLQEIDPLMVELYLKYGKDSVLLITKSEEGLDYVLNNLTQKMIVILDLNFKAGEPSGVEIFEQIRSKTTLVYILIWTASVLDDINKSDLKSMINNDALALLSNTDDIESVLNHVEKAAHYLEVKVSNALEYWINTQPDEDKTKPYLTTREGNIYTLNDILREVRLQTPFGMETEKNILLLAIDLLKKKPQNNG